MSTTMDDFTFPIRKNNTVDGSTMHGYEEFIVETVAYQGSIASVQNIKEVGGYRPELLSLSHPNQISSQQLPNDSPDTVCFGPSRGRDPRPRPPTTDQDGQLIRDRYYQHQFARGLVSPQDALLNYSRVTVVPQQTKGYHAPNDVDEKCNLQANHRAQLGRSAKNDDLQFDSDSCPPNAGGHHELGHDNCLFK